MKRFNFFGTMILLSFVAVQALAQESSMELTPDQEEYFSRPRMSRVEEEIKQLVQGSSCASETWRGRGPAPLGYLKGMALSFARGLCRLKTSADETGAMRIMSSADRDDLGSDVFSWYRRILNTLRIPTEEAGENSLRSLYTVGLGLGMRESSGKYCEGWDRAAGSHRRSDEAEAGIFQISLDSIDTSAVLNRLYRQFRSQPGQCDLRTFKEEVACRNSSTLGRGDGAVFQKFVKACPAFGAEYAMTLLRILRSHFGPINRREAEVKPTCNGMLRQVQNYVGSDPYRVCRELLQ